MSSSIRTRSPDRKPAKPSLEAAFKTMRHQIAEGVWGQHNAHVLFGPESGLNACTCPICKYLNGDQGGDW